MTITLKCGDCLELMKELPDQSVDCVITDPPYFRIMTKEWNGNKHNWDNQWDSFKDYLAWLLEVCKEIKRVSKKNASFYIFADDKRASYVRQEIEKLDYSLINEIIWVKNNNMTIKGWTGYRCYAPITERLLFFGRAESEYEIAVDGVVDKVFSPLREYLIEEKDKVNITLDEVNILVGTASMAGRHYFANSQWCFPIKEHYERMQLTFNAVYKKLGSVEEIGKLTNEELINKLSYSLPSARKDYEVLRKDYEALRKDYEVLRRFFQPSANFTDIWFSDLTSATDNQIHPTQKPLWLMRRIVETSCKPYGTVLDPFAGSGSTGVACQQLGRNFIGYEISPEYFSIAQKRINEAVRQVKLL